MARVYELTDKGRGMAFKNQQALVHGALLDGPRTAEQIAESIKAKLVTRQAPVKVAQFYLSVWKKEGVVKISNDASDAPANVVKTDELQEVAQLAETAPVDAPVSEGTSSETVTAADIESVTIADGETAPPATSELPALQQGENETLMAFIFRLVDVRPGIFPTDVEEITSGAVRKKQAADTMRRLQGAGHIARTDNGYRVVANNRYTE